MSIQERQESVQFIMQSLYGDVQLTTEQRYELEADVSCLIGKWANTLDDMDVMEAILDRANRVFDLYKRAQELDAMASQQDKMTHREFTRTYQMWYNNKKGIKTMKQKLWIFAIYHLTKLSPYMLGAAAVAVIALLIIDMISMVAQGDKYMTAIIITTESGTLVLDSETRKTIIKAPTEDEAYRYCYECDIYVA